MKVMDVKMDTSEDCTGSIPKPKKLKQARLPFQMLSSPLVPNTVSAKKRKLSSPSPTNYKSPKVSKLEKKENSLKEAEVIDVDVSPDKNEDADLSIVASGSPDTVATKDKKLDPKHAMKPGALTTLFQKIAAAPPKPPPPQEPKPHDNNVPIVLLSRCDDKTEINPQESTSTSAISANNPEESTKNDDSSNESLAEVLPISEDDDDDDDNSKGKSTDNNLDNSESDTEISSSEDEKKSNDETEEVVKNSSDNNLLKTPEPNKNRDKSQVKKHQLTPKQLEKRLESAKKREEREKLKAERQMQRNEEKIKRRKELEEKKKARKEREEAEKELKRKEKEQKEMKKQMEIEQKQKEKERKEKAKEEDKRKREEAKEEEKRKKEEEKLEAERKKQKAASTFVSFFVPKKLDNKTVDDEKTIEVSNFMPFEIKADMKIAPVYRRLLTDEEKMAFDDYFRNSDKNKELYLQAMKKDKSRIRRSGKTWPNEAKDDVVIIEEEEEDDNNSDVVNQPAGKIENQRAKLLAFKENRRPPYWGTWRKKSTTITPRRPFAKDTKWFDYEVDSDEEWEEEEPGESLRGSDDEKDEENPDDNEYDVDNEFMVPHGYLSDEEAQADEEDDEEMAPEMQKDKLKILEEEFEAEMKTKTSKIKPKVIGCIWQGFLNSYPDNVPAHIVNFLMVRQAWVRETPIPLIPPAESENQANSESLNRKKLPEEAIPDLIRLVHGNLHGRPFLVKEFVTYWNKNHSRDDTCFTKVSVSRKIKEISKRIACPDEGPMQSKTCWYVPEETRKKYSLEDLRLPNQWTYLLTPKRKTLTEGVEVTEKNEKDGKEKLKDSDKDQKKTVPLITMFTKKITQEEMQKQLLVKPTSTSKPSTSLNRPPRRATLISVPRGEHFPQNSILTAFSKATDAKKAQEVVGTCDKPITLSDDDDDAPAKREENSESTTIDGDISELKKDTEIQQITEKLDNENEMEKTK